MAWITPLDGLHAHYGTAGQASMVKLTDHLTQAYRSFLDRSRFCILSTVGPEGTDASPRGDDSLCQSFSCDGKSPRTVIVIQITEVYSQCARALIRSGLWTRGDQSAGLPEIGDMLWGISQGGIDGQAYDADWPGRAAKTMW